MSSPPFVLPQGNMQIPPNYAYKQVGMRGFPLKANWAVLNDLVNRCLNDNLQGTAYSYKPIQTFTEYTAVHLIVSTYGSMTSTRKPFSGWGTMSQTEAIFTIPLLRYKNGHLDGLALFTPYSFVDNGWSIITGNLIMGFQKGLASFQVPPVTSSPYPTVIDTPVFRVFGPPLSWQTWIRIEKNQDTLLTREPESLWPIGSVDDLFGPQGEFKVEDEVLAVLHRTVRTHLVSAVQLLQLRDPVDPALAAYSKVVNFAVELKHLQSGGLLAAAEIDLLDFASLPVHAALGLVANNGRLVPIFPYWVDCDFDFELEP
jgi:hypothetical protein